MIFVMFLSIFNFGVTLAFRLRSRWQVGLSAVASSFVGELQQMPQSLTRLFANTNFNLSFSKFLLKLCKTICCETIYFSFRPKTFVQIVVKATMLIELKGINMAATTGANCPVTAKYNPIIL
mgnify:FL=1